MEITTAVRQVTAGVLLRELALRVGAELAVKVVGAPPEGGKGTISLAGTLLKAQLPPGLEEGQKLAVRVVRAEAGEVVLKVVAADARQPQPERGELARAAGALAVSGDHKLVEVANGLQQPGLALPLPNGDAITLSVGEQEDDERQSGEEGEAAFVLHSAAIGPIEVRLRLGEGRLGVSVVVDPAAEADARAAAPQLLDMLAAVTSAQPTVDVVARSSRTERPAPPQVEETFDAYA